MERFVKGDVVVIPFPFSDLSANKKRPALVLTSFSGEDILLCQITSQCPDEKFAVSLKAMDFTTGSLPLDSFIRTSRLFTADNKLIIRKVGSISFERMDEVINSIIALLKK
jgi:mRNA interferase MazF